MVTHRPLAIVALDLSTHTIEQAVDLDAIGAFMWEEIEGWNAALSAAPEDDQDSDPGEDVAAQLPDPFPQELSRRLSDDPSTPRHTVHMVLRCFRLVGHLADIDKCNRCGSPSDVATPTSATASSRICWETSSTVRWYRAGLHQIRRRVRSRATFTIDVPTYVVGVHAADGACRGVYGMGRRGSAPSQVHDLGDPYAWEYSLSVNDTQRKDGATTPPCLGGGAR